MQRPATLLRLARRATRTTAAGVAAFVGLSVSACSTTHANPASPNPATPGQNGAASSGAGPQTSTGPN